MMKGGSIGFAQNREEKGDHGSVIYYYNQRAPRSNL